MVRIPNQAMKPSPFHCTVTAVFAALAPAAIAATFTVSNTNDAGLNSLRWAIQQANGNAGPDLIDFNIPAFGSVPTISLNSPLPPLTDQTGGTTIDGFSQPTAAGAGPGPNPPATISVGVELDGSLIPLPAAGGSAHGIWIRSVEQRCPGAVRAQFPAGRDLDPGRAGERWRIEQQPHPAQPGRVPM